MDKYKVIVTDHAMDSLREIRDYIAYEKFNPTAAAHHLRLFQQEIGKLSDSPEMYKLIDEQPWHDEGVRKIRVKNYYIYYWIKKEKRIVYVTDVIYAGRDQPKQPDEMPMR